MWSWSCLGLGLFGLQTSLVHANAVHNFNRLGSFHSLNLFILKKNIFSFYLITQKLGNISKGKSDYCSDKRIHKEAKTGDLRTYLCYVVVCSLALAKERNNV